MNNEKSNDSNDSNDECNGDDFSRLSSLSKKLTSLFEKNDEITEEIYKTTIIKTGLEEALKKAVLTLSNYYILACPINLSIIGYGTTPRETLKKSHQIVAYSYPDVFIEPDPEPGNLTILPCTESLYNKKDNKHQPMPPTYYQLKDGFAGTKKDKEREDKKRYENE